MTVAPLRVPVVVGCPSELPITETSAVIEGGVDPRGLATDYGIEYRFGGDVGHTARLRRFGDERAGGRSELVGLRPGATYRLASSPSARPARPRAHRSRSGQPKCPARAVRAMASKGKAGHKVALRYQVHDQQGETYARARARPSRRRVLATLTGPLARSEQRWYPDNPGRRLGRSPAGSGSAWSPGTSSATRAMGAAPPPYGLGNQGRGGVVRGLLHTHSGHRGRGLPRLAGDGGRSGEDADKAGHRAQEAGEDAERRWTSPRALGLSRARSPWWPRRAMPSTA